MHSDNSAYLPAVQRFLWTFRVSLFCFSRESVYFSCDFKMVSTSQERWILKGFPSRYVLFTLQNAVRC